ncbi:MAG: glycoside hydrolase family 99-like domain-containing protein, partial [Acidobacteria bacterium]|nr:glycoside hydrolase family 99-like domain-containing protein [Acidobacteriota bacterium]
MSNASEKRDEIRNLKRALEEKDRALASVLRSKSWRATRPLRWLTEALRGARPPKTAISNPVEAAPAPVPAVDSMAVTPEPIQKPVAVTEPDDDLCEAQQLGLKGHTDIRLIAFYLPQFHPIPENDRLWGRGFTEWTNTSKAKPLFEGHHQPRLPGELGFYDLRVKEVQRRQIELARQAGISGFCYHYYWFNGRKLLDLPLRQVLEDPSLDFPFCLSWANEPWTARWDGISEQGGVLIPQDHSPEDDIAFLVDIEPALLDPRYIRVDGKPLLAVYRPGLFPDVRATAERWQEHSVKAGIGELYLALVQNVYDALVDPRELGFDAAIEFPPAYMECVDVRKEATPYAAGFPRMIYSYPEVVRGSLDRQKPDYTLLRGVMPGWDNTARRKDATLYLGVVLAGPITG